MPKMKRGIFLTAILKEYMAYEAFRVVSSASDRHLGSSQTPF